MNRVTDSDPTGSRPDPMSAFTRIDRTLSAARAAYYSERSALLRAQRLEAAGAALVAGDLNLARRHLLLLERDRRGLTVHHLTEFGEAVLTAARRQIPLSD